MNLAETKKVYASIENLHFRVSVADTLSNLKVGDETFILFRDSSPSSIRATALRLREKKFLITEKGYFDRTFIKRKS